MNLSLTASDTSNISSSLVTNDCDVFMDSSALKILKTAAYSTLLFVSLTGNSLIVAAILRKQELRTIINFFVLNMCISDLLMPIFVLPKRIKQVYFPRKVWLLDGVFGLLTCKFTLFLENTSVIVSVIGLLVISIERLYCVVYPLKRQPIRTKRTCFALIAISWMVGVGFCSHFLYTQRLENRNGTTMCVYSWKPFADTRKTGNTLHLIFLICFTIIPFIALSAIYLKIAVSLHRKRKPFCLSTRHQLNYRIKQCRRISLMVATVVAVFLLAWTPVNIYIFLRNFAGWKVNHPCRYRHLIYIANYLSYSYIAINPFIYYTFNIKFKRSLHEIFCSCFMKTTQTNSAWTLSMASYRPNQTNVDIEITTRAKCT